MQRREHDDWTAPHLPSGAAASTVDGLPLARVRDSLTSMAPDPAVERAVLSLVDRWLEDRRSVEPLQSVRALMDSIRTLPRDDRRLKRMNTLVRTIGQPPVLATFLDMLMDSAGRTGTSEQELSLISQNASQHCIYGWAGQTVLVTSSEEFTEGTLAPDPGVREMLGEAPTPVWGLSMHIWQPNPRAKGFASGTLIEPRTVVEPPHSHPFDFASMVAVGTMHQSIYAHRDGDGAGGQRAAAAPAGRYDGTELEHVHGVWPPHDHRTATGVVMLERVPLRAGDSYFMSCDRIHDVEIDAEAAAHRPAITLFLASEAVVKPHVYMSRAMADFHDAHPNLKRGGRALPPEAWHSKLEAVTAYLRGSSPTLDLRDIVKYDGEYAFFHA
jgi:hypothetical protein